MINPLDISVFENGKNCVSFSYRTMYPITDAQLNNYINKGTSWKWIEPENT